MIVKGREPASLTSHRENRPSYYDNYPEKDELRQALVNEQRGLCCYCMCRIQPEPNSMKIEHWRSQSRYPDKQLDYRNLLGACLGGHKKPIHLQHCDTKKGERDLKWNPADPAHQIETRIRYEPDGSIGAEDNDFDDQINEVLNLNHPLLRQNRKSILDAVLNWWKREQARLGGPVSRGRLLRERDKRVAGAAGELTPYCQVAVWWLEQKLAKMAA